jgi:hypothetical protein
MCPSNSICRATQGTHSQVVLCDSGISREAHRELFRLENDKYILCTIAPIDCISKFSGSSDKLQLSFLWERLLHVALWRNEITIGDTLSVLKAIGLSEDDLNPFRGGEIGDIFPVLYYGKNFDALRRVCTLAKKVAENKLKEKGCRVDCHLVSENTKKIVASSL